MLKNAAISPDVKKQRTLFDKRVNAAKETVSILEYPPAKLRSVSIRGHPVHSLNKHGVQGNVIVPLRPRFNLRVSLLKYVTLQVLNTAFLLE